MILLWSFCGFFLRLFYNTVYAYFSMKIPDRGTGSKPKAVIITDFDNRGWRRSESLRFHACLSMRSNAPMEHCAGKSRSLIARELRDALCASPFAQLCDPPEAQSSTQGFEHFPQQGTYKKAVK
ncbi:MAG: hypothetical protein IKF10_00390 [Lachnospiraceae bacterium]|nr:hypothetical protein [Lachnospiraceae bacterium]